MRQLLLPMLAVGLFTTASAQYGTTPVFITGFTTNPVTSKNTMIADTVTNSIWVGYRDAGAAQYANNTWTIYDMANSGIPSNKVFAIAPNGVTHWFGTSAGLAKLMGNTWTVYDTSNSAITSNAVQALQPDGPTIWVGTDNGLCQFDGTNWVVYNTSNSSIAADNIKCITRDATGLLIIGTTGGLSVFNPVTQNWTNYTTQNSVLDVNTVLSVYCKSPGDVWLSTNNEVYHLIGSTLFSFSDFYETRLTGKPEDVKGFCTNNSGHLVFFSNKGLITLVPGELPEWKTIIVPGGVASTVVFLPDSNCYFLTRDFSSNQIVNGTMSRFDPAGFHPFIDGDKVDFKNGRFLDVNEVSAPILNRGDMHWNGIGFVSGNEPIYEVPKGGGAGTVFLTALWIGGLDQGGSLHQAAMTYRQTGRDFWPGPLDTVNVSLDSATAEQYDYIWKIDRTKLNDFQYHFAQGNVQNGSYIPDYDIIHWPAHGNQTLNQARNLAPFVDVNGNGIYDPLTGGDYPEIKGDQMLYSIFNDKFAPHTESSGAALGLEIHASAYAYACPNVDDSNKVINHTTFYKYEIFNRSTIPYHDCYVGFFQDVDLGFFGDDYVGCYPPANMSFVYNGDGIDGSSSTPAPGTYGSKPPTQANVFLNGPAAEPADGIDNDNDGTIDENGEVNLLTNFLYYENGFSYMGNPQTANDYYGYLHTEWLDGSPVTFGGTGYGGTTDTSWMYCDLPYTGGWSELTGPFLPGDRRGLSSAGPFNFGAGQKTVFEFAMVYTRDTTLQTGSQAYFDNMVNEVNKVSNWYRNNNAPSCMPWNVGIKEPPVVNTLQLYPNPATDNISLEYNPQLGNALYHVLDIQGRVLQSGKLAMGGKTTLGLNELPQGLYFIQLPEKGISSRFIRN